MPPFASPLLASSSFFYLHVLDSENSTARFSTYQYSRMTTPLILSRPPSIKNPSIPHRLRLRLRLYPLRFPLKRLPGHNKLLTPLDVCVCFLEHLTVIVTDTPYFKDLWNDISVTISVAKGTFELQEFVMGYGPASFHGAGVARGWFWLGLHVGVAAIRLLPRVYVRVVVMTALPKLRPRRGQRTGEEELLPLESIIFMSIC